MKTIIKSPKYLCSYVRSQYIFEVPGGLLVQLSEAFLELEGLSFTLINQYETSLYMKKCVKAEQSVNNLCWNECLNIYIEFDITDQYTFKKIP